MVLFVISMLLVAAVILGKYLIISEIRRLEDVIRGKQQRLIDTSGRVRVAQQRLTIAQKGEGLAAHKVATLRYRFTHLEEQMTQVELLEIRAELEKQREVGIVLDKVVRKALSQAGLEDEDQVRKVMGAISNLIDLEKQGNSDDLIAAIREKLIQLKEGALAIPQEEPPLAPSTQVQPSFPKEAVPLPFI